MEEVKGVIEEVSAFDSGADASADFSHPSAAKVRESYLSTVSQCKALWQLALPQFGMYSYEYEWANLISAYRCNSARIDPTVRRNQQDLEFEQGTRAELFSNMLEYLPKQFLKMREDGGELAEKSRTLFEMLDSDLMRHMEIGPRQEEPPSQVEFFILNYSMAAFRAKYRDGMQMNKVRVNFAPHAYMFAGCQPGDTRQVNIHAAIYTQWNSQPMAAFHDPNMHGIEECCQSDNGRISINPVDFLSDQTLTEVHLHPAGDGNMAVSPNNCAFLVNLTLPVVNFSLVMVHHDEQGLPKLTMLNVTLLNEEALADCAILCALNSEMLLQSITAETEKSEDLEAVYLKRLKGAIETGVLAKLGDQGFVDSHFDEGQTLQLFHRKIWLTLGCPRIDDIGGKVHRELQLDSRVNEFKKTLLRCTLTESIFRAHQGMLAYGQSKPKYQDISVQTPMTLSREEEKYPDERGTSSSSAAEVNQRMAQLTQQVELHMEMLLTTEGYSDDVKQSFEALPGFIQDLISYKVWELFGKIEGIHNDFGRHSYLHLPGQLNDAYYASPEARVQLICSLLDELRAL